MISPQDLKRSGFSRSLKGYSTNEVDEYIDFLISKYGEAYAEFQELSHKYQTALNRLDEAKSEESTISATIVNAQKMADAIVNDAKEKASSIKNAVSDSCEEILAAYREKVSIERDKLEQCEKAVAEFKSSLYEAYKHHITMIDGIMPDEDVTQHMTDDELEEKAVENAREKLSMGDAGEDMSADTVMKSDADAGDDDGEK